jgi:hypothetical protein
MVPTRHVETLLKQLLRHFHLRRCVKARVKEEKWARTLEAVARHAQLLRRVYCAAAGRQDGQACCSRDKWVPTEAALGYLLFSMWNFIDGPSGLRASHR